MLENDCPLVSVILPVYNGADHLDMAVESARRQTYNSLEIIVVDDGSTDGTLAILQRHAKEDDRIRIICQENAGVARARNRAIAAAQGDFIAPLDADDLWDPTKIERQVQRFREAGENTGCVYGWWVWIDDNNDVLDCSPAWTFEGSVFEELVQINFTGNASVPLFRKQCVIYAGGYNETLAAAQAGGCEDWELVLRVAERFEMAVVPEVLLGYRRRTGSMSTACDTMRRSQQEVMKTMRQLRPVLSPATLRRSDQHFALYLAGVAFWSGNRLDAVRWGFRAGLGLALAIAPYLLRIFFARTRPSTGRLNMKPGISLEGQRIPSALLPYDKLRTVRSS